MHNMGAVVWSRDAEQDLLGILDPSVQAEIMDLAEKELVRPSAGSILEALVRIEGQEAFMRRAVRRRDLTNYLSWSLDDADEFGNQACDYVIAYRYITADERIKFRRARRCFVILRVLHNRQASPPPPR